MTRRVHGPLSLGSLLLVVLAACSSSGDEVPPPIVMCSSGPVRNASAALEARVDPNAPLPTRTCALRCGDASRATWGTAGGLAPTFSALPTGSCALATAPACTVQAVRVACPAAGDAIARGQLFDVECTCVDGAWDCRGTFASGDDAVFPPCPVATTRPAPEAGAP